LSDGIWTQEVSFPTYTVSSFRTTRVWETKRPGFKVWKGRVRWISSIWRFFAASSHFVTLKLLSYKKKKNTIFSIVSKLKLDAKFFDGLFCWKRRKHEIIDKTTEALEGSTISYGIKSKVDYGEWIAKGGPPPGENGHSKCQFGWEKRENMYSSNSSDKLLILSTKLFPQ